MWMYVEAAHPTRDRSLFYIGDLNRTLNQPYFIACLKEMAIHFSLEPEKSAFLFSTDWGCFCTHWLQLLYHFEYGLLEVLWLLNISATNYTDGF